MSLVIHPPATRSFNSQRDGILRWVTGEVLPAIRFQFPTGWNSTETYRWFVSAFSRFNSQRDGILRKRRICNAVVALFQFPTGWNSTLAFSIFNSYPHCFNSQRDGILLLYAPIVYRVARSFNSQRDGILHAFCAQICVFAGFQFPTGWNSTRGGSEIGRKQIEFQFPTGWNSTVSQVTQWGVS